MRRGWTTLVVVVGVFAAALHLHAAVATTTSAPAPTRTIDGRVDDWHGASTQLGGTWQVSKGELVYQDHLYDDLGANTGQRAEQYGTVQNPMGDVRYPTDDARYGRNAADLLELRLAVEGDDLLVLARLNTLKAVDSTVVALGFGDADADTGDLAVAWPHAAGVTVPGVDHVVTLWGPGGDVTDLATGESSTVTTAVDIGNDHNAIEARIPLATLGRSDAGRVRVWAVTGLWSDGSWLPIAARQSATEPGGAAPAGGTWPVLNVAFRDHEAGSFFEDHQAAALQAHDIHDFSVDVDLGALAAGADGPSYPVEAGRFYSVILDTGFTIGPDGEGVAYTGIPGRFQGVGGAALSQEFNFFGRHQPYGLYLPSTHNGVTEHAAALVLHGLGGSHASYNKAPGFLAQMGEGVGTGLPKLYLITPLARGSSFYADWGEVETLRVLADVLRRVPVDEDRLYLTGYSMGGYGVYRLASLYPDRFAAAAVWAGYTGEFTGTYATEDLPSAGVGSGGGGRPGQANIGNPVLTLSNLRELPLLLSSGTNDEIVPTPGQYAAIDQLRDLGYRNRWDLYPGYEHFSFGLVDEWTTGRAWLADEQRPSAPRRVSLKFSDGWTAPGLAEQFGLVHGNAWWLRDLTMRTTTDDAFTFAAADALSHGLGGADPVVVDHPPTAVAEPTPHLAHEMSWTAPPATALEPATNRLDLDLTGVGHGTVDLARAGLSLCGLSLDLTTDGPVDLRLVSPVVRAVKVSGAPGATFGNDKVLHVPSGGAFALRFTCAGAPLR
jgi:dienelactone hydrolase